MKEILDNAKNGVLLVSWGGNVKSSSMPEHIQHELVKGFAKLSLQVIWKWENVSIQEIVSKNVFVTSWLPQQDILCKIKLAMLKVFRSFIFGFLFSLCSTGHPNVKVFWTHGGNLGLPIICMKCLY